MGWSGGLYLWLMMSGGCSWPRGRFRGEVSRSPNPPFKGAALQEKARRRPEANVQGSSSILGKGVLEKAEEEARKEDGKGGGLLWVWGEEEEPRSSRRRRRWEHWRERRSMHLGCNALGSIPKWGKKVQWGAERVQKGLFANPPVLGQAGAGVGSRGSRGSLPRPALFLGRETEEIAF